MSKEEQLKKKRERERERRRLIRENPVRREQHRLKERRKYERQKQTRIKKSINDMTPREQRLQRKKWSQNSKVYRNKKKQSMHLERVLAESTPPQSEDELNVRRTPLPVRTLAGRRLAQRHRVQRHRDRKTKRKIYCCKEVTVLQNEISKVKEKV